MRISDWSSDVCSSDLPLPDGQGGGLDAVGTLGGEDVCADQSLGRPLRHQLDESPRVARRKGARHIVEGQHGRSHVDPPRSGGRLGQADDRSEEHTSELQSLMRISYAVFCLKKKNTQSKEQTTK